MNKFKVFFAKCTKAADGLTVGKNYPCLGLPMSDLILNDARQLVPVPIGCDVFGMVVLKTTRDMHDPDFHAQLIKAREEFCAVMHPYYC